MTESFDPVSVWLVTTVIELLMVPLMLFVFKRMVGKRLDIFDQKRERARTEQAEDKRQREAERAMVLAIARTMLLNNYEKCMEKGFYTVDEREVYSLLYESYKKDDGNGIIDTIAERIRKLPLKPPKESDAE